MNKIFAFPGIALILLFVFACTIPSELEITGSPSLKFAANMNFNDYFSDMLDDILTADGDSKIIPCTNPSLEFKVFLLYMEIFRNENYEFEVDESQFVNDGDTGNIKINGVDISVELLGGTNRKFLVLDDDKVIAESDKPYTLTFKNIENYIEGFEFTGIQSKVYISGTQLADIVRIDLYKVGSVETIVPNDEILRGPSEVELLEEYTGLTLPPFGGNIEISDTINSGGNLSLEYKIYLPMGAEIDYDLLDDMHTIAAEIVIWLPMTLKSVDENANFKFPDFFDGISDVLKSLAGTGCIENMNIKVAIDPLNPFGNGIFVIKDDNYDTIQSSLDNNSFSFGLDKKDLEYINKNPFDPNFSILYPQINTTLEIPNGDIIITTVSLDAELKYNMEFKNE
jgi:hypothetical protein